MKEEETKKQLAEILRANIHYSPQLENYVVHGAIEAIWRLMQEYAAQSAPKQSAGIEEKVIKEHEAIEAMRRGLNALRLEVDSTIVDSLVNTFYQVLEGQQKLAGSAYPTGTYSKQGYITGFKACLQKGSEDKSEWQLCPKCSGKGTVRVLGEYASGVFDNTCDVCNGAKILVKPLIKNKGSDDKIYG